jgi:serine/threonine protein kinase
VTAGPGGNTSRVTNLIEGAVLSRRYRLEAPLGAGATAAVWRARDLDLGRVVAVKVLRAGVEPELANRFEREATILGRLDHPNLVRVLASGHDDEQPYLVMDFVDGVNLRERLGAGPLPVDDAVALAADVAAGLATAHRAGVVHRDVKPGNVVCGHDGVPRLVDFGIARVDDLTAMTQADSVLGTARYLSPEQARGEVPTAASDVYALGCVLYELLTGAPPFDGDSGVAIAYRHVNDPPAAPSEQRPEVPAAVDAVVLRCLAKDPRDRYPTGAELQQALRQLGVDEGATTVLTALPHDTMVLPPVAAATTGAATVPGAGPPSRRAVLGLVAVGAFAIAFVVAGLLGGRDRGAAPPPPTTTTTVATSLVTTTTEEPAAPGRGNGKGKGKNKNDDGAGDGDGDD